MQSTFARALTLSAKRKSEHKELSEMQWGEMLVKTAPHNVSTELQFPFLSKWEYKSCKLCLSTRSQGKFSSTLELCVEAVFSTLSHEKARKARQTFRQKSTKMVAVIKAIAVVAGKSRYAYYNHVSAQEPKSQMWLVPGNTCGAHAILDGLCVACKAGDPCLYLPDDPLCRSILKQMLFTDSPCLKTPLGQSPR